MSYSHIGGDSRASFPELESLFQTIESGSLLTLHLMISAKVFSKGMSIIISVLFPS